MLHEKNEASLLQSAREPLNLLPPFPTPPSLSLLKKKERKTQILQIKFKFRTPKLHQKAPLKPQKF